MITFNGLTSEEILALPAQSLDTLVLTGQPLVFQAGTAEILARFWIHDNTLILELGHIDGGGEGVLPALSQLAHRLALHRNLSTLDWRVHAVTCKNPNPKLRHLLHRRGFTITTTLPNTGPCYHKLEPLHDPTPPQ